MLELIHRNRKSLGLVFIIALVCLMMSGFGLDYYARNSRSQSYAITVNDRKISFEEFDRERRMAQDQMRSAYGAQAAALMGQISEQTADRMVNDALVDQKATSMNLVTGENEVATMMRDQIFPQGYDPARYEMILQQVGMTSAQFEARLAEDLRRQQFTSILADASLVSKREARAGLKIQKTNYDVDYVELNPTDFMARVSDPGDEALQAFYQSNSAQYELPVRVQYTYAHLAPNNFLDLVMVQPEDIELEYTDNQSQYTDPEQVKFRSLTISYPKDAKPEAIAEARKKADEALVSAKADEPFEKLITKYSSDSAASKAISDWTTRGKNSPEFDRAVFALKAPGVTDLISLPNGFQIVKVEEYKPSTVRPLDAVRAQIEKVIREREAPAYVSEKARSLYDSWSAGDKSLTDFAKENNLVAASTNGLLSEEQDPDPTLKGITKRVIFSPDQRKQIIEIGEHSILVEVLDYKDSEVPPLASVRDRVLKAYVAEQSKTLARAKGEELVKELQEPGKNDLRTVAKAASLTVKSQSGLSRAMGIESPFSQPVLQQAVFSVNTPMTAPRTVYESGGKQFVIQVRSITPPDDAQIEPQVQQYVLRESQRAAQNLVESISVQLKSQAEINMHESVMARQ